MPLVKQKLKPGFDSLSTQTENASGWFNGNLVRWRLGHLEKLAGWQRLIDTPCMEHIRAMHAWEDLENNENLLIGTDAGPQLLVNTTLFNFGVTGSSATTGNTTFDSSIGSAVVTVHSTFAAVVGGQFTNLMRLSIGGIIIPANSTFTVTGLVAGGFTFNMGSVALSTEIGTVGVATFAQDVTHVNQGVVTFKNHGLVAGNTFTVDERTVFTYLGQTATIFGSINAGTVLTVAAAPAPTTDTFAFVWPPGAGFAGLPVTATEGDTGATNLTVVPGIVIQSVALSIPVSDLWYADNLGQNGLLVASVSQLFVFTPPVQGGTAGLSIVGGGASPTAPQLNTGMFTAMPQAQVIVWGTEPVLGSGVIDPLLLRWSDAGSFDIWIAEIANQAGSYRLSRGSKIVGGIQAPQTTLILTDTDIWSMAYIGTPLIYGFTILGSGCGLIAPKAIGTLGRNTYWMSRNGFWRVGDGGVQPLPCSLWDTIFRDLDVANIERCFVAVNSSANEIAFWYPSLADAASIPAQVNLLWWSQKFEQFTWKLNSVFTTVAANATAAPDSTATTEQIVEGHDTGSHGVFQVVKKPSSPTTYTAAIFAHTSSNRKLQIDVSSFGGSVNAVFDPTAQSVLSSAATGGYSVVSTSVVIGTGGWARYILKFTTNSDTSINVGFYLNNGTTTVYTGNGTSKLVVWGSQLTLGSTVQAYVATAAPVANECGRYVKYNALENLWDSGFGITRTAWLDNNIFGNALGADQNFRIQQHDIGYDNDDQPMRNVFAETGYVDVQDGTIIPMIDRCEPDFKWFGNNGGVNVTFKTVSYAGSAPRSYGPFSTTPTTQYFCPRVRGKRVAVRYDWAPLSGFSARVGAMTFRTKRAGGRP
jgi:hypothetical protein